MNIKYLIINCTEGFALARPKFTGGSYAEQGEQAGNKDELKLSSSL